MNEPTKSRDELTREVAELRRRLRAAERALATEPPASVDVLQDDGHLRDFFENAAIGLHWVDGQGRILWANKAELELLGYASEEYVGRHIAEFHADAACIRDILARLTRGETIRNYEARLRCKDGSIRHVLISSSVLFRDGEFVHTRCFTKDVTEKRLAELELRRRSQQLQLVLDGVGDHAISMLDAEGRVQTFNAPAERIKGYALREVQGQHFRLFFTEADRAAGVPERELEVARDAGRFEGEGWRRRKDGTLFYAAVSVSPLRDAGGALLGYVKVTQDVTEKRRLAEALRRREAELRLLLDAIPGLVAYVNPDHTYRLVNQAYEQWFGRPAEQVVGRHAVEVLGEAAYASLRPHIEAALAGQPTTFETEVSYAAGGTRWVRAAYAPDVDADGRIHGYVSLVLDVTETRRIAQRFVEEARVTETLHRIGTALAQDLDRDAIVQRLTDEATALCRAQFGAFFYNVRDDQGGSYMLYTLSGVPRERFEAFPVPRVTEVFAATFTGARVVRADDITRDPRYGQSPPHHGMPPGHLPVRSYLAVPVVSRSGEVHGGLFFGHAEAGVFTERDERVLVAVAAQAAVALDNARLHAATLATEQKYRALTESSPQLVWTTSAEGAIEYCNQRMLDFVGLTMEAFRREPVWHLIVHPDDAPRASAAWSEAVRTGEPYELEYRFKRAADGAYRWFLVRGVPVRDPDGRIARWVGSCTDIDDRREAERALSYQHQLTRTITDNATAALFLLDDRHHCTFMNPAAAAMTGWTLDEVRGRPLHSVLHRHPEERHDPTGACPIDRALEGRATARGEDVFVRRDRTFFPVAFTASPIVEAGRTVGTVLEVHDITEDQRAADALRMQARVLQSMAEGVSVADERGVIVYTNAAEDAMFGYGPGELVGQHVTVQNAYPAEENARVVDEVIAEIRARGAWTGEWRNVKKDGTPFVTRARITTLDLSGRPHFVCVQADVTREKRDREAADLLAYVSAALAASLDYRATVSQVAQRLAEALGTWCAVFLRLDDGATELLAAAHVDATRTDAVRALHERYPPGDDGLLALRDVLRTGQSELRTAIADADYEAAARDAAHLALLRELGATSWLVVPLAVQGRRLGALRLARGGGTRPFDARDLALAEEVGRRVGVALDNARLFEMTQRERQRAEEASRAKDELLSVTSHELRTPLNAILGWSRMLRSGALADDKRERALETIERNAKVQVQLVEDLLDVSRVITGRLRLNVAPVELVSVVEAAVDVVRPAAEAKGVRMQVVLDPDAGLVLGDAGRLQQVVWNLLSNATKFTPRGGRVHVRLQRTDSHVELLVGDTGQGIAPEFLPHVFQPFRQQDASITRAHGGLGLGLAIVKHLVELHGGTIQAQSDGAGRGATFVVRLPIAALRSASLAPTGRHPAPAIQPGAPLACPPELDGLHVVVVDDEDDAVELVRSVLEQCGARVRTANSAAVAMDLVQGEAPDVLISDIGMPDESGYELIRKVRALPPEKGGRIPAIALTAYASMSDRTRALMEGYTNHCAKPTEPQELVAVVAALVGRNARR